MWCCSPVAALRLGHLLRTILLSLVTLISGSTNSSSSDSSCQMSCLLRYSKLIARAMFALWYTNLVLNTLSSRLLQVPGAILSTYRLCVDQTGLHCCESSCVAPVSLKMAALLRLKVSGLLCAPDDWQAPAYICLVSRRPGSSAKTPYEGLFHKSASQSRLAAPLGSYQHHPSAVLLQSGLGETRRTARRQCPGPTIHAATLTAQHLQHLSCHLPTRHNILRTQYFENPFSNLQRAFCNWKIGSQQLSTRHVNGFAVCSDCDLQLQEAVIPFGSTMVRSAAVVQLSILSCVTSPKILVNSA